MKSQFLDIVFYALVMVVAFNACANADTYVYTRRYLHDQTNIGATIDPFIAPSLKTEYGVLNRFDLKSDFYLAIDFILRASIQGITDPPESWKVDVKVGKIWRGWELAVGHGRFHNISRPDSGTSKGFGFYKTYIELGYHF